MNYLAVVNNIFLKFVRKSREKTGISGVGTN